jgi:hypothetical protein
MSDRCASEPASRSAPTIVLDRFDEVIPGDRTAGFTVPPLPLHLLSCVAEVGLDEGQVWLKGAGYVDMARLGEGSLRQPTFF